MESVVPRMDPITPVAIIVEFFAATHGVMSAGYLANKSMMQGMIMARDAVVMEPKRAKKRSSRWTPAAKPKQNIKMEYLTAYSFKRAWDRCSSFKKRIYDR